MTNSQQQQRQQQQQQKNKNCMRQDERETNDCRKRKTRIDFIIYALQFCVHRIDWKPCSHLLSNHANKRTHACATAFHPPTVAAPSTYMHRTRWNMRTQNASCLPTGWLGLHLYCSGGGGGFDACFVLPLCSNPRRCAYTRRWHTASSANVRANAHKLPTLSRSVYARAYTLIYLFIIVMLCMQYAARTG